MDTGWFCLDYLCHTPHAYVPHTPPSAWFFALLHTCHAATRVPRTRLHAVLPSPGSARVTLAARRHCRTLGSALQHYTAFALYAGYHGYAYWFTVIGCAAHIRTRDALPVPVTLRQFYTARTHIQRYIATHGSRILHMPTVAATHIHTPLHATTRTVWFSTFTVVPHPLLHIHCSSHGSSRWLHCPACNVRTLRCYVCAWFLPQFTVLHRSGLQVARIRLVLYTFIGSFPAAPHFISRFGWLDSPHLHPALVTHTTAAQRRVTRSVRYRCAGYAATRCMRTFHARITLRYALRWVTVGLVDLLRCLCPCTYYTHTGFWFVACTGLHFAHTGFTAVAHSCTCTRLLPHTRMHACLYHYTHCLPTHTATWFLGSFIHPQFILPTCHGYLAIRTRIRSLPTWTLFAYVTLFHLPGGLHCCPFRLVTGFAVHFVRCCTVPPLRLRGFTAAHCYNATCLRACTGSFIPLPYARTTPTLPLPVAAHRSVPLPRLRTALPLPAAPPALYRIYTTITRYRTALPAHSDIPTVARLLPVVTFIYGCLYMPGIYPPCIATHCHTHATFATTHFCTPAVLHCLVPVYMQVGTLHTTFLHAPWVAFAHAVGFCTYCMHMPPRTRTRLCVYARVLRLHAHLLLPVPITFYVCPACVCFSAAPRTAARCRAPRRTAHCLYYACRRLRTPRSLRQRVAVPLSSAFGFGYLCTVVTAPCTLRYRHLARHQHCTDCHTTAA